MYTFTCARTRIVNVRHCVNKKVKRQTLNSYSKFK